jgi:hypothetical protein
VQVLSHVSDFQNRCKSIHGRSGKNVLFLTVPEIRNMGKNLRGSRCKRIWMFEERSLAISAMKRHMFTHGVRITINGSAFALQIGF